MALIINGVTIDDRTVAKKDYKNCFSAFLEYAAIINHEYKPFLQKYKSC